MHYNPAAFTAANLPPPDANWTLDDFQTLAQQLTRGNGEQKQYGFAALGDQSDDLATFLRLAGVAPARVNGDALVPTFTDPALVAALQRYLDLLHSASPHTHLSDYSPNGAREPADTLVLNGRVGMWLDANGAIGATGAATATGTLVPLPTTARSTLAPQPTQALYILARTTHPKACWAWLTFLSSQQAASSDGFPARSSLATADAFTQYAPPGAAELYAAYRPLLNRAPDATTPANVFDDPRLDLFWFYRAIDRALGGKDLARKLADAKTTTEAYLACVQGGTAGPACATQADPIYAGFQQAAP